MWSAIRGLSDFGGLVVLAYFLYRTVIFLRARWVAQHRRDSAELDGHRKSITDRAKRADENLELEVIRLRAEAAQSLARYDALRAESAAELRAASARYEALQERRFEEVKSMLAAGGLGDAAAFTERALDAVYNLQRAAPERDALLADTIVRKLALMLSQGAAPLPDDIKVQHLPPPHHPQGLPGNDP